MVWASLQECLSISRTKTIDHKRGNLHLQLKSFTLRHGAPWTQLQAKSLVNGQRQYIMWGAYLSSLVSRDFRFPVYQSQNGKGSRQTAPFGAISRDPHSRCRVTYAPSRSLCPDLLINCRSKWGSEGLKRSFSVLEPREASTMSIVREECCGVSEEREVLIGY